MLALRMHHPYAFAMTMATHNPAPIPSEEDVSVVIVAAGRGERAGTADGPKQYRRIGGRAVLARTIDAFLDVPAIGAVVVVIHPDDHRLFAEAVGDRAERVTVVDGGRSRQESTFRGLLALEGQAPGVVLIHDGVRPFVDAAVIARTLAGIAEGIGALPALPVSDTLKRGAPDGAIIDTVSRENLHAAQTPQGFRYAEILNAHRLASQSGLPDFTDDAAIAEWAGMKVRIVLGAPENVKLTWAKDIAMADRQLTEPTSRYPDVRTGNGYDVHAFEPGDFVTLCGVEISHDKRLNGHSDADVGLHALTDALLATCGVGDIGTHFPPSDPQWKGAASRIFVEHAVALVRAHGGRIANADITLICEAPKIGPHRTAMTQALSAMLGIDAGRVSVKATTNERLGFIGREEGIAAIATASVVFPGDLPE